ncbi:hypothetical protein Tco_0361326 [Tanacetum coccineum]
MRAQQHAAALQAQFDALRVELQTATRGIFAIMEYFLLLNTPADQQLRIVGFNLEGAAAEWFWWMTRNGLITDWARFVESKKSISLQSELASPKIKGSLNADEDIGVDKVSSAVDGVFDMGESNVESMEVHSKFGEFSENTKSVEEVMGDGEALRVGEDDDSGNVTTNGGDDAVESGDISILNSLIGHGSSRSSQLWGTIGTTDVQVLIDKWVDKEVQYYVYTLHVLIPFLKRLNDKYIKKNKMKAAMQRRL